jgi:AcrR family transcriptional regulator
MPTPVASNDHRPRVAAERRERMRKRLIESAMIVFAQKGMGSSVIPDVVAAAGVSQGSFYNYFRTNDDLLAAVSEELSVDMVRLIETAVGDTSNPAQRVSTAVRSYLHLARSHRVVARFLSNAGLRLVGKRSAVYQHLPQDLQEAQQQGCFDAAPLDVALDLIAGAGLVAIHRMATGRTAKDYPDKMVAAMLRSLGLPADAAAEMAALPLPKLAPEPDSLLARAQARLAAVSEGS